MQNILDFKVYYKDTDAEGVVYYANYLGWLEAGRCELIEQMGFSLKKLKEEQNLVFAIRDVHCEYLKPARLLDQVQVITEIAEVKPARIIFKQKVVRKSDQQLLLEAEVTAFPIDLKNFKPVRVPDGLKII